VVIGMVVGLALARLLTGLARFVQHPGGTRPYAVHLVWTAFKSSPSSTSGGSSSLGRVGAWSFAAYVLVIAYAAPHVFTVAALYPHRIDD
jgi:hypothetical protein